MVEPETVRRIAALARVGEGDHVVEVGAGLGALTLALADTGASIIAVEVDSGLVNVLRENVSGRSNVSVVHDDAMRLDWQELLKSADQWVMVANLPYNVATPLVADVLDGVGKVRRMLVMVQKEVAERLVARPGDEAFGAVSLKLQYWASSRIAGEVSAAVFLPRPRVASALVEIVRHERPPVAAPPEAMFDLIRRGFATRRKMLRRALENVVTTADFTEANVSPQSRAEELSLEDWSRLTMTVLQRRNGSNTGTSA